MPRIDTKYLRELAVAATQGKWIQVGEWVENVDDDKKDICNCSPNGNEEYKDVRADAVYISAAQPSTMIEILDELDRLYLVENTKKQNVTPTLPDRIMLRAEVEHAVGRKKSWIYDAVKRGDFPAPFSRDGNRIAWWLSDIATYIENLKTQQRETPLP